MNSAIIGQRIQAIAAVAQRWQDPDYMRRATAVEQTLASPNRYTEEGLAFALNHLMHHLSEESLRAHAGKVDAANQQILIRTENQAPLASFSAALAAVLRGYEVHVERCEASPWLLHAFWNEVEEIGGNLCVVSDAAPDPSIPVIAIKKKMTIAVIDGKEHREARENLAEDLFLHDGQADENVTLLWAPADLTPDVYLETFAQFRSIFPAHPGTMGSLKMQQAFLKARNVSHAYGEGFEFLVSKGEPDVQTFGHVRWVPYTTIRDVESWLEERRVEIKAVVSRKPLAKVSGIKRLDVGMAHRQVWYESSEWHEAMNRLDQYKPSEK